MMLRGRLMDVCRRSVVLPLDVFSSTGSLRRERLVVVFDVGSQALLLIVCQDNIRAIVCPVAGGKVQAWEGIRVVGGQLVQVKAAEQGDLSTGLTQST